LTSFRLLGAGLGLAAVLALSGALRPPPRADYPIVWSVAVVRLALVYGLVTTALLVVPPGRSSLLTHTAGLWAAPIGAWYLGERLTGRNGLALLFGIGGIVLLMDPWSLRTEGQALVGYGMLLGAAIATAAATVHMRSHRWAATPLALMPWQLSLAGAISTILALAVHGAPTFAWGGREIAVIAYQVVLASGFGVWGTITLSRSLPAVSTGILMMAVPVIGVASSVLFVHEVLTAAAVGGIVLVLIGVGLNVLADRRAQAASEAPV
jgi:drug/metabolite transporter (DMT)-like permease